MTLTGSGQISFSDINIELGRSSTAIMSINDALAGTYGFIQNCATPFPDPTDPDPISEWYSYNHSATASLLHSVVINSATSCNDACLNYSCGSTSLYKYNPNGKHYFNLAQCYTSQGTPTYTAVCSGGSTLGQNCYTFNGDRTLASTQTCTTTTTTTTTTTACTCAGGFCSSNCFCAEGSPCSDDNDCNGVNPCQ